MSRDKDLNKILDDDPFGLLFSETKKSSSTTPEEKRLISSFEEISNFYEEHNREPEESGISEFKLFSRLKYIRKTPSKVKILKPYDMYGLLSSTSIRSVETVEILDDDPLGILDNDFDESIFELENVERSERVRPDYLATNNLF